jgi:hypothetical protein
MFKSKQYVSTKIIVDGEENNTQVLLEYEDKSQAAPSSFKDLKGINQLFFMPRIGQDKVFDKRYPYFIYYSKNIKNQVVTIDSSENPIIYQADC